MQQQRAAGSPFQANPSREAVCPMASDVTNVKRARCLAPLCLVALASLDDTVRSFQGSAKGDRQRLEVQITEMAGLGTF